MVRISSIKIKSNLLILNELSCDDITQEYINWLNDPEVNKYLELRFVYQDERLVKEFVKKCAKNEFEFLFGIFTKDDMKHIGNIKLGPINKFHNYAEVGLMIGDKSEWGKGYGSHAISIITQFAFEQLDLSKLGAGCYKSNLGSKKIFQKAGYQLEGVLKDHVLYNGHREDVYRFGINNTTFMESKK